MNPDIIDLNEVLERVQNDRELLLELFGIFLEDCPVKISAMKEAVQRKDFAQLKDIAHSMKGASGNISAKSINALFLQIEQMAKNNNVTGIEGLFKGIEKQLQDLKIYSDKLKQELQKTK